MLRTRLSVSGTTSVCASVGSVTPANTSRAASAAVARTALEALVLGEQVSERVVELGGVVELRILGGYRRDVADDFERHHRAERGERNDAVAGNGAEEEIGPKRVCPAEL